MCAYAWVTRRGFCESLISLFLLSLCHVRHCCCKQSCYVRDAADLVSTAVTMDYILDFATVFLRFWAHWVGGSGLCSMTTISYSSAELLAFNRHDVTPLRATRKTIFSLRLRKPVRQRKHSRRCGYTGVSRSRSRSVCYGCINLSITNGVFLYPNRTLQPWHQVSGNATSTIFLWLFLGMAYAIRHILFMNLLYCGGSTD